MCFLWISESVSHLRTPQRWIQPVHPRKVSDGLFRWCGLKSPVSRVETIEVNWIPKGGATTWFDECFTMLFNLGGTLEYDTQRNLASFLSILGCARPRSTGGFAWNVWSIHGVSCTSCCSLLLPTFRFLLGGSFETICWGSWPPVLCACSSSGVCCCWVHALGVLGSVSLKAVTASTSFFWAISITWVLRVFLRIGLYCVKSFCNMATLSAASHLRSFKLNLWACRLFLSLASCFSRNCMSFK